MYGGVKNILILVISNRSLIGYVIPYIVGQSSCYIRFIVNTESAACSNIFPANKSICRWASIKYIIVHVNRKHTYLQAQPIQLWNLLSDSEQIYTYS